MQSVKCKNAEDAKATHVIMPVLLLRVSTAELLVKRVGREAGRVVH